MSPKRKPASKRKTGVPPHVIQEQALVRLAPLLNAKEYASLLHELETPLRSAIRVNVLKVDSPVEAVRAWAQRYAWDVEPVPFCETGWWVSGKGVPIAKTIEHRLGLYYIQDAASMLPVELFDFSKSPNSLILDMAASPGGKTTHLVSKTADHGLVIANDSSAERITALRLVIQTWGALNISLTQFPGEKFGMWYAETFDKVLLDAPCSMENLRSSESHPMRPISPRERQALAKRQVRLLESAFRAVKPGGQIVYATCTLAPEEDEAVLDHLLHQFHGAVNIENVSQRLPFSAPALAAYGAFEFDAAVQHAVRLYPHLCGTSGFFSALITKTLPVVSETQPAPQRSLTQVGFNPLTSREETWLMSRLLDSYQFNLQPVLDDYGLQLWRRDEKIYAFPLSFLRQFASLPCRLLGLEIGEVTKDDIIPSHEWVTCFHTQFKGERYYLDEEQQLAWLRGEDVEMRTGDDFTAGIMLVENYDHQFLGRGKVFQRRLKNLLPRRFILG